MGALKKLIDTWCVSFTVVLFSIAQQFQNEQSMKSYIEELFPDQVWLHIHDLCVLPAFWQKLQ